MFFCSLSASISADFSEHSPVWLQTTHGQSTIEILGSQGQKGVGRRSYSIHSVVIHGMKGFPMLKQEFPLTGFQG